jgi:hypothetical protein
MNVNSDLKQFAVFINSKTAIIHTTEKSEVTIPFTANLASHDPLKIFKFSIVDVLFSNVFYNIRLGVQTLKYLDVFAPGRGLADYQTRVVTVVIPPGYYSYDTLTSYLDTVMGDVQSVTINASTFDVFNGFGSDYAGLTSDEISPAEFSTITGKVFLQSPSLGDMYQPVPADNSVTSTTGYSEIYAGKYLIVDEQTYPLMHTLGYVFDSKPAPAIPHTSYFGLGFPIYNRTVSSTTEYSFDNVFWGTSEVGFPQIQQVVPICISDLTGLDDLYIHCAQLRTQFMSGILKQPLTPGDVIAVIPINVPFGDKVSFVPNFPLISYLRNTNLAQLTFRMTNSNNQPLDFNGVDWSMTVFCEEVNDDSKVQLEDNPGNMPTPFQLGSDLHAGAYMENKFKKARSNMLGNNHR